MLYTIWTLLFLAICAIIDIKERKVFSVFCCANSVIVLFLHFIKQDISWFSLLWGMILGAIFFMVSICTREAIGKGDAIVIFTMGSMVGIKITFEILVWAFVICTVASMVAMLIKKVKLDSRIPFIPFVLFGGIITFVIGGRIR